MNISKLKNGILLLKTFVIVFMSYNEASLNRTLKKPNILYKPV